MNIVFGKKYWLVFCQEYGTLAGIRSLYEGEYSTHIYQFNDENTGTPHFVLENNLNELVTEGPADSDMVVLKRIEEKSKETNAKRKDFVQMDLFSMMEQ